LRYTQFFDLHSGGYPSSEYAVIYIEAPEDEARRMFTVMFGDPDYVSCDCCGCDYAVYEVDAVDTTHRDDFPILIIDANGRRSVLHAQDGVTERYYR
jgi:hypothetical protein